MPSASRKRGQGVKFEVGYPDSMTLAQYRALREMLAEIGTVQDTLGDAFYVEVLLSDIEELGQDVGPDDWALDVFGLPARGGSLPQDVGAVFGAISLGEWWASLTNDLSRFGATVSHPSRLCQHREQVAGTHHGDEIQCCDCGEVVGHVEVPLA